MLAGCTTGGFDGLTDLPHQHTASLDRGGQQAAELDVVSGAATLTVATAPLGGELLRAWTPAGSGIKPALVAGDSVQLFLDGTGLGGPAAVKVVLNSAVRWRLRFSGGATQTAVSLAGGRFGGADFTAGSSLISMTMPRPAGTVTVELAGGASQVSLAVPAGVPARLRLDGGASTARLAGHTYTGLAGGTVLAAPGWAQAVNRYDIDAPAGVSTISVTTCQRTCH
jgi:hypothetical protein